MDPLYSLPYIEPSTREGSIPFERYLPGFFPGIASVWLSGNLKPGSLVLEPIGASPQTLFEIARAGFKIIVAINNPITAFLVRILSTPPSKADFQSILAELSTLKRGSERLETHLTNLYLTRCAGCRHEIPAEGFIWRKGESAPYAKIYTCPSCGDAGQHPVVEEDLERLVSLQRSGPLHRARALDRASGGSKESMELIEEALNFYSPRALYFIFTLLNKVEGMALTPTRRMLIDALLLTILDNGHAINPWPPTQEVQRLFFVSEEYIERNLWQVMEESVNLWTEEKAPVQVTDWPELPQNAGICLFQGRMRELKKNNTTLPIEAVISVFPRPNQVFWTFSAIWASWIWGKEKSAGFMNVLERRRFDWFWHSTALQSALAPASAWVTPSIALFGILPEPVTGLINAVIEATAASNFQLGGCAIKNENLPVQFQWTVSNSASEPTKVNHPRIIRESILRLLNNQLL
jgi:hypothetical protein